MFCSGCGAKNAADSNFCRQCGRKLDASSPSRVSEEDFDRALPVDEQVTALLERAYRLRKSGDTAGAIALCHEVLGLRPDSTTAHGLLGQLYEQAGERDKAVAQYERVLQLNPGSIADRVKLDDLREGAVSSAAPRNGASRVVMMESPGGGSGGALPWGIALAAVLILSGTVLALVLNNRRTEGAAPGRQTWVKPGTADVLTGAGSDTGQSVDHPSRTAKAKTHADAAVPTSASTALNAGPAYAFGAPTVPYAAPTIVVTPGAYTSRTQPSPAVGPVPNRGSSRSSSGARTARLPADSDSGSERVHLGPADTSQGGEGHSVVINVSRSGDGSAAGNGGSGSAGGGTAPAATGPGTMKMRQHSGPVDPGLSYAATSEASGLISVAQEKINKMDYNGAALALRRALAGANDESGYVWQTLGKCYQSLNDNRNALTSYERARDEYKKLLAAGRQMERASEGIRVCETGIKICSSE